MLIGLRASGKTSIGREAARRLAVPFLDLDDSVARSAGAESAGEALRALGEPRFRELESARLLDWLSPARRDPPRPALLALGGGAPTAPGAAAQLEAARSAGLIRIVLLDASIDALAGRLESDPTDRPALTALRPRHELEAIAAKRLPAYRSLADVTLDTTSLSPAAAVEALVAIWRA